MPRKYIPCIFDLKFQVCFLADVLTPWRLQAQPGGSTEATGVSAMTMSFFFFLKCVKTELFKKWFRCFLTEYVLIFILSMAGTDHTSTEVI